jgi:hypothetical protein
MADTVTVACPECDKKIKVAEETLGKKIRCKECDEVFVAKAPGKKAPAKSAAKPAAKPAKPVKEEKPAAAKKQTDDDDDGNPYGVTTESLGARCPHCAGEMEEDAIICLECGYNTRSREMGKTRKVKDVTGGDVFLWLLPGILCVLGVIGLITWDILYCVNADDWFDGAWYEFLAHLSIKMWMCIISVFFMFFLARFAVKRLIFDNSPPEREYH